MNAPLLAVTHAFICPLRSRFRRWRYHQPLWADDKTARMLGIAHKGCPRCGKGADALLTSGVLGDPS